jgi:DNA-binding NtrC family response regulator
MAKILIVNNEPFVRKMLTEQLEGEGHAVTHIARSALIWGHLGRNGSDIVLLNLYVDGFRSWKTYQAIKAKHPHLPVFVFVARGFDAIDHLKKTIGNVLAKRRSSDLSADTSHTHRSRIKYREMSVIKV